MQLHTGAGEGATPPHPGRADLARDFIPAIAGASCGGRTLAFAPLPMNPNHSPLAARLAVTAMASTGGRRPARRLPACTMLLALVVAMPAPRAQSLIAWGDNARGQCNVPGLVAGQSWQQIACGDEHSLARRSDGAVLAFGDNQAGQCNVPPMPPGVVYVDIAAGARHSLARRSDGVLVAFGDNQSGQCNVPPLPVGLLWVEIAAGADHSVARCSDGSIRVWGSNAVHQLDVPPLHAGLSFVHVAAGRSHCLAIRSDGELIAWGDSRHGRCRVPPLPAGLAYDGIAGGARHSLAHRSDGSVVAFGDGAFGQCTVPPLSPWQTFFGIAAGASHSLLLRSTGFVSAIGDNALAQCTLPVLPPGRVYLDVAAGRGHSLARFGAPPLARAIPVGTGCGSPSLTLTAATTPILHTTWRLETQNVPPTAVLGLHVLGASNPGIGDLAAFGMPGCGLYASLDVVQSFVPQGSTQAWSLDLPLPHTLIGQHLFATSLVWTVPAVNAAGMLTANGIDGTLGV